MFKKLLFLPPILIGIAVLIYMASGREGPEKKPLAEYARTVRVITAEPVRLVPRVIGFGSVYPGTVWNATAQVGGEVVHIHPDLKKGAILPAGTEIVRISPANFLLAVSQAQANIRSAEAKLAELEVTETNTTDLLAIEKRGLALRRSELARKQNLLKRGTVARSALELEQRETLAQRKKVQDLENTLRLLPTQRAVQREQIAVYRSQLDSAKLDLARTRITLKSRRFQPRPNSTFQLVARWQPPIALMSPRSKRKCRLPSFAPWFGPALPVACLAGSPHNLSPPS
jgi:multidrug efflux system membrane fusion protein